MVKANVINNVVVLLLYAVCGAERLENWLEWSGERPLKNGRSVERSVERDATERA